MILVMVFWCNILNAKEVFYIRCIPEVTIVRAGDDLKEGDILQHRLMYFVFENEIDLTVSEKPKRILKKHKLYMTTSEGKKDKLRFSKLSWVPSIEIMSIDFENIYEEKSVKYFSQMNVNYDGGSWVSSGTFSMTKVKGDKLEKDNFSWFGKCIKITKKHFKKPEPNKIFYDKHK